MQGATLARLTSRPGGQWPLSFRAFKRGRNSGSLALLVAAVMGAACAPTAPSSLQPIASPSHALIEDVGDTGIFALAWPTADSLVGTRLVLRSEPQRQELVSIDPASGEETAIRVDVPTGCTSIDALMARVIGDRLVFDRYCYAALVTDPRDGHELMLLPSDGGPAESLARLPWFPDAFIQLDNGTWLSSYDSGMCAWIEVVPDTGEVPFGWPIEVTDDGEPYAVNAGRQAEDCANAPLASNIAQGPGGALGFLATGAGRGAGGFGRLDLADNLYRRESDGVLRRIASDLHTAGGLVWRPGTDALTAYATIEGRAGIWAFDPDGSRTFLYEGRLSNFAWSPDGLQLAVIVPFGDPLVPDPPRRLHIITP